MKLKFLSFLISIGLFATVCRAEIIAQVTPSPNAVNVPVAQAIAVAFTVDMNASTINDTTFLVRSKLNGMLTGTIVYVADQKRAFFIPANHLKQGDLVTINLTSAIESVDGAPVADGYTSSFTVEDCASGDFDQVTFSSGSYLNEVIAADLNNDGNLDLVTCSQYTDSIQVLISDGAATFTDHTDYYVGENTGPNRIYAADFNSDGFVDLVTVNSDGGTITVYFNDGSAGFPPANWTTIAIPNVSDCFPVDLDNDGHVDIVAAGTNSVIQNGFMRILYNAGDGTFESPVDYSNILRGPYNICAGDFGNDGKPEIVVTCRYSQTATVFTNEGNRTFNSQDYDVSDPYDLDVADLNGDGYLDLVIAGYGAGVEIMSNNGSGGFVQQTPISVDGDPHHISIADYNGDGHPDIALSVINSSYGLIIEFNNGDGTFGQNVNNFPFTSASEGIFSADLTNDASVDLISAGYYTTGILVKRNLGAPRAPDLVQPVEGKQYLDPASVTLQSADAAGSNMYVFEVSDDSTFATLVAYSGLGQFTSEWTVPVALSEGTYYWRAEAANECGQSSWSQVRSFEVLNPATLSWLPMTSGTETNLADVWGALDSSVYAVGENGTILHYDGTAWSQMTSGITSGLSGVWGTADNNVYAVSCGFQPNDVLHYDGTAWSSVGVGTSVSLSDIWGTSSADIYAVGATSIWHYDGTAWTEVYVDSDPATQLTTFYGVWGTATDNVYAVGMSLQNGSDPQGVVYHFDGAEWSTIVTSPDLTIINDIWGNSPTDIYAVGSDLYGSNMLHYDGTSWTAVQIGDQFNIYSVWGDAANDVFVAGNHSQIYHFDGTAWTSMSLLQSDETIGQVFGTSSSSVFAVGSNGTILKYNSVAAPTLYAPVNGKQLTAPVTPHLNCNDVSNAEYYEFEIDDNLSFSSPVVSSDLATSEWTVPTPLNGGTYYWRARAKNATGYGPWSDVWRIYVLNEPDISCPILFSYDGSQFVRENPLLTACEQSGYVDTVIDFYQLTSPIRPKDGKIAFQVHETEDEITSLSNFELITVDHRTTTNIGCTVDGKIFSYSSSISPISAVDNNGVSWIDAIEKTDNTYYKSSGPGYLIVTFPTNDDETSISFGAPPKLPCLNDPPNPKVTSKGEEKKPIEISEFTVEQQSPDGSWTELPQVPTRTDAAGEFVMTDLAAQQGAKEIVIRISWDNKFETDEIRQYIPSDEHPIVNTWKADNFSLSADNPAAKTWAGFNGSDPLILKKGESAEFSFDVPELANPSQQRTYIVKAVGKYEPDYSVYTNLIPNQFELYNNYPNPFNPTTTIAFDLPAASQVKLEIVNVLGQTIKTLVDEQQQAGHHEVVWDGTNNQGSSVASGVYFYKLTAGVHRASKKMMLLK